MDHAVNSKGLKIVVGSRVRYVGTGTIGVVKAINLADGRYWAFLDSTNLYYDIDYLEPLSETGERRGLSLEARKKEVELVKEDKVIEKSNEVTPSGAG